jgi:hypothetical protein
MDLGDWHPRDIPEALLTSPALQRQQTLNLPPLEQWYLTLLHDGKLPGALPKRRSTTYTINLIEDAREKVPRLRELTDNALRNFLVNEDQIGAICTKYRSGAANGWTFPPLAEARDAWARQYGPQKWDAPDMIDWGTKAPKEADAPKADKPPPPTPAPAPDPVIILKDIRAARRPAWRRL